MSATRAVRGLVAACALVSAATGCREEGVVAQHRVAGGDAERGKRLLVTYGCGGCHVIPGVRVAEARVGPPLTDFADRAYIAGALRNEPEALVRWIRDPQEIEPGTAMPDLGVGEQDARDMAAYLYTLTGNRLGPPHPIPARLLPGH